MILCFEHFDPINGEYPNTFPEIGSDIVYRAREIVKNRTKLEIEEAVKLINWLIEHSPAIEQKWDQLLLDAIRLDEKIDNSDEPNEIENTKEYTSTDNLQDYIDLKPKRNLHSQTYMLSQCKNVVQLIDHPSLPNLTWSDLFAVLSLTLINQAIDDEKYYGSWHKDDDNDWLHDWRVISHSSYWIIESMNAIATAEGVLFSELQVTTSKRKLSDRNTLAAIQRHAQTNKALIALAKFWNEGNFKSMRNASQIFCEKFPDQVSHLAHYNRIRTLSEGLSNLIKGQRQSVQS